MSPCTSHPLPEEDEADLQALPSVLGAVAGELLELVAIADRLQLVLSPVLVEAARNDSRCLVESQALDLLIQRLQGLRRFVGDLAPETSPSWTVDAGRAAAGVGLADLARRLGCARASGEAEAVPDEFEMF